MKKLKYILLMIAALILSSCIKEDLHVEDSDGNATYPGYFILSTAQYQTKVTYSSDAVASYFNEGDKVGVFALDADKKLLPGKKENACYTVHVDEKIDIRTNENLRTLEYLSAEDNLGGGADHYLFYYPYRSDMTFAQIQNLTHSVSQNQNIRGAFTSSDLLWDVASPVVNVEGGDREYVWVHMDHAMAHIIIEIDEVKISEGTNPVLHGVKRSVSSANLLLDGLADIKYQPSGDAEDIEAWHFGYSKSGARMYRMVLPAFQTLDKDNNVVSFSVVDSLGVTRNKRCQLTQSINLLPGKTYYFKLTDKFINPIKLTDDDSWVLDVIHPKTGELVGLLCREYLRYQPGRNNMTDYDIITGNLTPGGDSKYITSQAWVFYAFRPGTKIPNLDEGVVMRFTYDIRNAVNGAYDQNTANAWPDPHRVFSMDDSVQGLFATYHGHTWVYAPGNQYGQVSQDWTENYMHGGTVVWDGVNDKIADFVLPKDPVTGLPSTGVTNQMARDYGHIAINEEGTAFVSYAPLEEEAAIDSEGNYVGILSPHCLIDRRVNIHEEVEVRQYPLVKIGYNQFWMSKSLRAETLIDGTPLIPFNKAGVADAQDKVKTGYGGPDVEILESGYLLPIKKNYDGKGHDFDPFNQMSSAEIEKQNISHLYNYTAVMSGKLMPNSSDNRLYHVFPKKENIQKMVEYCGWRFAAKMMTDDITVTSRGDDFYTDDQMKEILAHGYISSGLYTANISGLNLRAHGIFNNNRHWTEIGSACAMFVMPDNVGVDGLDILHFNTWNSWDVSSFANLFGEGGMYKDGTSNPAQCRSRVFAPVRFIIKFRGQVDSAPAVIM